MNLKIGGNSVGKIMYGGQEFGGATKLEPGTLLYISQINTIKNAHLLSTTKNWSNINGINIEGYYDRDIPLNEQSLDLEISSDDFKNLNTEKEYNVDTNKKATVSRSIVDGEYRLNFSYDGHESVFLIKAI